MTFPASSGGKVTLPLRLHVHGGVGSCSDHRPIFAALACASSLLPQSPIPPSRWSWNLKECPLTTRETPQDFAPIAGPGECQNDLDLPSVADAVIDKRRRVQASRAASARNASGRRRFVDPTTCERDYNQAEMEFMSAMQVYKQASGRMFPTWSEVLEVLKGLGYEKRESGERSELRYAVST